MRCNHAVYAAGCHPAVQAHSCTIDALWKRLKDHVWGPGLENQMPEASSECVVDAVCVSMAMEVREPKPWPWPATVEERRKSDAQTPFAENLCAGV